jgi:Lysylphosphatidylglycerol synthase TM region
VNYGVNTYVLWLLKLLLFVLLAWFVVNRLFVENNASQQWHLFCANFAAGRFYVFLMAAILMPVNWLLETAKWRILLNSHMPFKTLLKSVIAGITLGFITPGRAGEFVGRVVFLDAYSKTRGFYLSSMGGFAQTAASLIIGVPFVYIWSGTPQWGLAATGVGVIYLLAFFRFDLLNRLMASIPLLRRYGLIMGPGNLPNIRAQLLTLFISLIRFATYTLQYVLLLDFFGVQNEYWKLATYSIVYLLAQTFSPLMPLLDMGYRSGSALLIFKPLTADNLAVLSAVMTVWLINLVIPALAGYWFIFRKTNLKWTL